MSKSEQIKARLEEANVRYWAGDNISEVLQEGDKEELIEEAASAFENVLDKLLIDRHNDPKAYGSGESSWKKNRRVEIK